MRMCVSVCFAATPRVRPAINRFLSHRNYSSHNLTKYVLSFSGYSLLLSRRSLLSSGRNNIIYSTLFSLNLKIRQQLCICNTLILMLKITIMSAQENKDSATDRFIDLTYGSRRSYLLNINSKFLQD